jgi:hypothetical protein
LDNENNQWLRSRLGKAITQRRQFLCYAREHRNKLSKEPRDLWNPIEEVQKPTVLASHPGWDEVSQAARTDTTRPSSTLAPTDASTLFPIQLPIAVEEILDDVSQTSFALSTADEGEDRLRLPRLSDVSKGQSSFECPLCWTIQDIRKESVWRKHAFSDLRPYVCTFDTCDIKLFADRKVWFEHELTKHHTQWLCHFCRRKNFKSVEAFQKHISHDHVQGITEDQLVALVEASACPLDQFLPSQCPLCDTWETSIRHSNPGIAVEDTVVVTPSQFRHHVGAHMQDLALFAVPRGYLEEGEGDFDSDASNRAGVGIKSSTASQRSEQSIHHERRMEPLDLRNDERLLDIAGRHPETCSGISSTIWLLIMWYCGHRSHVLNLGMVNRYFNRLIKDAIACDFAPTTVTTDPSIWRDSLQEYDVFTRFPDLFPKLVPFLVQDNYDGKRTILSHGQISDWLCWLVQGQVLVFGPGQIIYGTKGRAQLGALGVFHGIPEPLSVQSMWDGNLAECVIVKIHKETLIQVIEDNYFDGDGSIMEYLGASQGRLAKSLVDILAVLPDLTILSQCLLDCSTTEGRQYIMRALCDTIPKEMIDRILISNAANSPWHIAAELGDLELARLIIQKGTHPAQQRERLIIQKGAHPAQQMADGTTALNVALEHGHKEYVIWLMSEEFRRWGTSKMSPQQILDRLKRLGFSEENLTYIKGITRLTDPIDPDRTQPWPEITQQPLETLLADLAGIGEGFVRSLPESSQELRHDPKYPAALGKFRFEDSLWGPTKTRFDDDELPFSR